MTFAVGASRAVVTKTCREAIGRYCNWPLSSQQDMNAGSITKLSDLDSFRPILLAHPSILTILPV